MDLGRKRESNPESGFSTNGKQRYPFRKYCTKFSSLRGYVPYSTRFSEIKGWGIIRKRLGTINANSNGSA